VASTHAPCVSHLRFALGVRHHLRSGLAHHLRLLVLLGRRHVRACRPLQNSKPRSTALGGVLGEVWMLVRWATAHARFAFPGRGWPERSPLRAQAAPTRLVASNALLPHPQAVWAQLLSVRCSPHQHYTLRRAQPTCVTSSQRSDTISSALLSAVICINSARELASRENRWVIFRSACSTIPSCSGGTTGQACAPLGAAAGRALSRHGRGVTCSSSGIQSSEDVRSPFLCERAASSDT
jgi:hypothetical protein